VAGPCISHSKQEARGRDGGHFGAAERKRRFGIGERLLSPKAVELPSLLWRNVTVLEVVHDPTPWPAERVTITCDE
jgi:hypothetical protein